MRSQDYKEWIKFAKDDLKSAKLMDNGEVIMKLSRLQKFILIQCKNSRQNKVLRKEFLEYYSSTSSKPSLRFGGSKRSIPSSEDQQNIITKSLARLIKRDLIVGFGEVTKERVFIERVRLTRAGHKEVRRLLDRQQRLPLKTRKRRKNF